MRRVEALTGAWAYEAVKRDEGVVAGAAEALKSEPEDLVKRAGDLTAKVRELERHVRELSSDSGRNWVDDLINKAVEADGVVVAAGRVECPDMDTLRAMGDTLRERLSGAAVGVLFASFEERPVCIVVVTDEAISGSSPPRGQAGEGRGRLHRGRRRRQGPHGAGGREGRVPDRRSRRAGAGSRDETPAGRLTMIGLNLCASS